ncbi:MAG: hypothetical protein ACI8RZ_006041 [Myxococcota bacterium]|jgi:hypothetical protein
MLLLLLSSAHASDVLLPEFTAGSFSDFEAAEQITASIDAQLSARRISVEGPDVILRQAEDLAVGCAEEPGCPEALLDRMPARLAVIGRVSTQGDGFVAEVSFYAPDDPSPIEKLSRTISATGFSDFAEEIADTVESLLPLIPPLPGSEPEPPDPIAVDPIEVDPEEPLEPEVPDDPRIRALPRQAQAKYLASSMTADDWLVDRRVRVGKLIIEAQGSAVFGDISRRYDTRISVSTGSDGALEQGVAYEYENFIQGNGMLAGVSVGYVPIWWLETGLLVGLMVGEKELTTGWEQIENGTLVDEGSVVYQPTTAYLGVIEPRLRVFFVATGPIKPYALGGVHLRIFDGYDVPDIAGKINYANRPGGLGAGVNAGAGVVFDAAGRLTGFLEIPWTFLISPEAHYLEGTGLLSIPEQATGSGQMLMFRAGVGVRL